MNRGKKTLATAIALITMTSLLASCDDTYDYPWYWVWDWEDGVVVTVGGKDYTFEDIYAKQYGSKDSAQSLYNCASDILAQIVTPVTDSIRSQVDQEWIDQEETWKSNASTNGTSYSEEQDNTFDSEHVEDEDELYQKMIAEALIEENETQFYNEEYSTTDLGETLFSISEEQTKKYVEEMRPYHVSHILANVDAADVSSDSTAFYDGHISESNAKKISNIVKQLTTGNSFADTAALLSDDGSASKGGELCGDGSSSSIDASSAVGMQKDTSYVNEFKLGIYAYDTFLNPETKDNDTIAEELRVPGTPGINENAATSVTVDSTSIANGEAFGIPLSIAIMLGYDAEQESADSGKSVDFTDETQYPRNIIFNNYFNNHSISFIYDDRETFTLDYYIGLLNSTGAYDVEITTSNFTEADYPYEYKEYTYIKNQLDATVDSCWSYDYGNIKLVQYECTLNDDKISATTSKVDVPDQTNNGTGIMTDEDGHPVLITRSGNSGDSGYQGIHFIIVDHDPFEDAENDYLYYRINVPDAEEDDAAYSTDYDTYPSFVNYVTADPNSIDAYLDRIECVKAAVKGYNSNMDFELFYSNLATFEETYNATAEDLFGEYWETIESYIQLTVDSSETAAEDDLDDDWETYVNTLNLQEDIAPKRVVPTVCISYYKKGSDAMGEVEDMCHVEK